MEYILNKSNLDNSSWFIIPDMRNPIPFKVIDIIKKTANPDNWTVFFINENNMEENISYRMCQRITI